MKAINAISSTGKIAFCTFYELKIEEILEIFKLALRKTYWHLICVVFMHVLLELKIESDRLMSHCWRIKINLVWYSWDSAWMDIPVSGGNQTCVLINDLPFVLPFGHTSRSSTIWLAILDSTLLRNKALCFKYLIISTVY